MQVADMLVKTPEQQQQVQLHHEPEGGHGGMSYTVNVVFGWPLGLVIFLAW